MAYPFVQLPTFEEFIGRLTSPEFKCTFETMPSPMETAEESISLHFLKRNADGVDHTYAIYIADFGERVTFSVLRSVCARLEIDLTAFGLELG